jgi:hypothetical protein
MRKWGSAVLAAALLASTATFAGTNTRDQGALAPGGAAGVQQAQTMSTPIVLALVGVAAAVAVIAIIASNNGNGSVTTTTTGTPN